MDKNWLLDFSGCDGGTIGSPSNRSIWFVVLNGAVV